MKMRLLMLAFAATTLAAVPACSGAEEPAPEATEAQAGSLDSILTGDHRDAEHVVRDQYRHPAEVLNFFGLQPGMTVVELSPGSGYWSEVLGPYLAQTGGTYVAAGASDGLREKLGNAELYGQPTYVDFGADTGALAEPGTADMVLTFRNIHNWLWSEGRLEKVLADAHAALKPGGVLGVVEHRSDPREMTVQGGRAASDGYVSTQAVIDAATAAGFTLDESSEINANPADTKDHPFGVWTLPPNSQVRGTPPEGFDPQKYLDIGESDRMTLRFVKPAA